MLLTHTSNRCHLAPLGGARGLRSRRFVKARASVAPETANTGEHLVFYERKDDVDGIAPIDVVTLFGPRLSDR